MFDCWWEIVGGNPGGILSWEGEGGKDVAAAAQIENRREILLHSNSWADSHLLKKSCLKNITMRRWRPVQNQEKLKRLNRKRFSKKWNRFFVVNDLVNVLLHKVFPMHRKMTLEDALQYNDKQKCLEKVFSTKSKNICCEYIVITHKGAFLQASYADLPHVEGNMNSKQLLSNIDQYFPHTPRTIPLQNNWWSILSSSAGKDWF